MSFFQALQAALSKQSSSNRKTPEQIDAAIRHLVSKAITTEGQVIDVFTAANTLFPALRSAPKAVSGDSRQKQIPSSSQPPPCPALMPGGVSNLPL